MLINPPIYTVIMPAESITLALSLGDLIQILTPADVILIPRRAWITTEDVETSQQIAIELATFATPGSGGSAATPQKHNEHLQASQTTCLTRNTTDASSTQKTFFRGGGNLLGAGWEWNGDGSIIVPISTSLVLGFASALTADPTIISAGIEFAELGQ